MNVSFFSGKLFLLIGALFLSLIIVLAFLPNEAETYPDSPDDALRTRVYRATKGDVLTASEEVIRSLPGWNNVEVSNEDDEIAAEYSTKIFHFVSDIRLAVQEGGNEKESEVDVTSSSRMGLYDFGVNADHIRELLTSLDRKLQRVR